MIKEIQKVQPWDKEHGITLISMNVGLEHLQLETFGTVQ
jgi:hypothetical protein